MATPSDQELMVAGSWPVALLVFVGAQMAILGLSWVGLPPEVFWLCFALIQAHVLWVSFTLIKPRKRLFFNGKRLLVCGLNGRKLACIERPRGFCSPFFIGLRLSPWRSLGLMALQMDATAFGKLLRWMRQPSVREQHKNGSLWRQSVQKR